MHKDRHQRLFRGLIGDEFSSMDVMCCEDASCCVLLVLAMVSLKSLSYDGAVLANSEVLRHFALLTLR